MLDLNQIRHFSLVKYPIINYLCNTLKKLLSILFCFIYLVSSAGINLNLHYCGGKVKSISLFHTDEKDCCGTKMKNPNCCKDKSVVYKVKETQNNPTKIIVKKNSENPFQFLYISALLSIISGNTAFITIPSLKEPPDIVYTKTYLVNCAFLI